MTPKQALSSVKANLARKAARKAELLLADGWLPFGGGVQFGVPYAPLPTVFYFDGEVLEFTQSFADFAVQGLAADFAPRSASSE